MRDKRVKLLEEIASLTQKLLDSDVNLVRAECRQKLRFKLIELDELDARLAYA
jgi:hypothetical protein